MRGGLVLEYFRYCHICSREQPLISYAMVCQVKAERALHCASNKRNGLVPKLHVVSARGPFRSSMTRICNGQSHMICFFVTVSVRYCDGASMSVSC